MMLLNFDFGCSAVLVPCQPLVLGDPKASGLKDGESPRVRYSFYVHSGAQSAFGIVPDDYDVKKDDDVEKTSKYDVIWPI